MIDLYFVRTGVCSIVSVMVAGLMLLLNELRVTAVWHVELIAGCSEEAASERQMFQL